MKKLRVFIANAFGSIFGIALFYLLSTLLLDMTANSVSIASFIIIPGLLNGLILSLFDFISVRRLPLVFVLFISATFFSTMAIAWTSQHGSQFWAWCFIESYAASGGLGAFIARNSRLCR